MSETLDSYDFTASRRSGDSQYTQYLDGGIYRLVVGEDIRSLAARTYLHTLAKNHGLKLRCQTEDNALVVQAYKESDDCPLRAGKAALAKASTSFR